MAAEKWWNERAVRLLRELYSDGECSDGFRLDDSDHTCYELERMREARKLVTEYDWTIAPPPSGDGGGFICLVHRRPLVPDANNVQHCSVCRSETAAQLAHLWFNLDIERRAP